MNNEQMKDGISKLKELYSLCEFKKKDDTILRSPDNVPKDDDMKFTFKEGEKYSIPRKGLNETQNQAEAALKKVNDLAKTANTKLLKPLADDCCLCEKEVTEQQYSIYKKEGNENYQIQDYIWTKIIERNIIVGSYISFNRGFMENVNLYDEEYPLFYVGADCEVNAPSDIKKKFNDNVSKLEKEIEKKEDDYWNNIVFLPDNESCKPIIKIDLKKYDKAKDKEYSDLLGEYTNAVVKIKALFSFISTDGDENQNMVFEKIEQLFKAMDIAENNGKIIGSTELKINDLIFDDCKQIVLTGAPGTGKTYSAKEYVKWQMMERYHGTQKYSEEGFEEEFDKEWKKEHNNQFSNKWSMVQFHPSFDYTDFVEGIRPAKIKDDEGKDSSSFVRMDGVFKKFCRGVVELENGMAAKDAIKNLKDEIEKTKDENHKQLMEEIKGAVEALETEVTAGSIKNKIETILNKIDNLAAEEKDKLKNQIKQVNNIIEDTVYAIENKPYYYFIIDEINRADLSKVFGELMFCLEESYRGSKNRIQTQYSNLDTYKMVDGYAQPIEKDKDVFKDGFYIPENVIIIGTMNDIDRSVDTFDFALRRRFRWINVEVDNSLLTSTFRSMAKRAKKDGEIEFYANNIMKMNNLMDEKEEYKRIFRTPKDFFVGPAYFEGLFRGQSMDAIWANKVEPLLREYVRGRDEGEKFIEEAKGRLLKEEKEMIDLSGDFSNKNMTLFSQFLNEYDGKKFNLSKKRAKSKLESISNDNDEIDAIINACIGTKGLFNKHKEWDNMDESTKKSVLTDLYSEWYKKQQPSGDDMTEDI